MRDVRPLPPASAENPRAACLCRDTARRVNALNTRETETRGGDEGLPPDTALRDRVFLMGLRYSHHARNSGYEAFGRYVGAALAPPVDFRWTLGKFGWPLSLAFARVTRHPWYSIGAHLTEWHALGHMLANRRCVFHVLYGDSDLWLLRRAHRLTGNRLVASFHQPTDELRRLGSIERVARHLSGAILVSEVQRPYFEEFLPNERVFVVPHGVNSGFFRPPDARAASDVCVTVGSHLRDFETLREAIKLIWAANPNMRFVAVGTRSDKKSYFPELPDDRIQFLDRISDEELLGVYQSATIAVLSFREATANNAMLEAMACGLPLVATDVGGIRDYVVPGTGILCPPRDPRSLANAALEILSDAGRREQMSRASRDAAVALDFLRVANRMADVYRRVLAMD